MTEAESCFGVFTVFDLANMEKIKEEKLELKSPLIRMLACKSSSKIFMVFSVFFSRTIWRQTVHAKFARRTFFNFGRFLELGGPPKRIEKLKQKSRPGSDVGGVHGRMCSTLEKSDLN